MTQAINLRDSQTAEVRNRLFEVLDDANRGDALRVVADRDVDPDLIRYQLDFDRTLNWEYAHPDAMPRELQVTVEGSLADDIHPSIDVRDLKPQRRHEALLEIFDDLHVGEGFVLVNDHDPKPLYHELQSMHGDVVGWEYLGRGDDGWRVEVVRTGESEGDGNDDIVTRYDVREIPKAERHPTIHHRYGMLPEHGTMELIAPHEPKPLHQEFRQQYGDAFTWEVVDSEPGRCRVQITKAPSVDVADAAASDTTDDETESPSRTGTVPKATVELDVRDRPPAERHQRIYGAYDDLDAGEGFVLVNDHDPKPIYHQFEAETGPEFYWEYLAKDPGEFRVLIGIAERTADAEASDEPDSTV